ncbi:6292_t:CDS:1, partial [Dentiscutata heterogama]
SKEVEEELPSSLLVKTSLKMVKIDPSKLPEKLLKKQILLLLKLG